MKKIIYNIKVWWFWVWQFRQYPTSEKLSKKLQYLIDEGFTFTYISEYTAMFGNIELWIANCPYASFRIYHDCFNGGPDNFIPNKVVGYELAKILKKSLEISKKQTIENYESDL